VRYNLSGRFNKRLVTLKLGTQPASTLIEYREVYDRAANLPEMISLIRDLDAANSITLLCQMSADFRLAKRDRESIARIQQDIAGGLFGDETVRRLKQRFGKAHLSDRPVFYPAQILIVARLVMEHSRGTRNPLTVC
jgi:hypothetical protein